MKLIDILEVADQNKRLEVRTANFETISFYDGKNSIEEKYNDCEVINVQAENDTTIVYIELGEELQEDFQIERLAYTIREYVEEEYNISKYFTIDYSAKYGGLGIAFDDGALDFDLRRDCEDMTSDTEMLEKAVDIVINEICNQLV